MRFSQRLSSHLTPEWRKHYVKYEHLKGIIYEMVGERPPQNEEEEEKSALSACGVRVEWAQADVGLLGRWGRASKLCG